MNTLRYEQLKVLVAEYGMSGKLDIQYPISQETETFLNTTKKDALSLLTVFVNISRISNYPFYGFELTGRLDTRHVIIYIFFLIKKFRKYLCVSEHEGKVIFGLPSKSKKEARSTCALRVIDCLIVEKKLQNVLNPDGKKIKVKIESMTPRSIPAARKLIGPQSAILKSGDESMDFARDTDYDIVCFFSSLRFSLFSKFKIL